MKPTLMLLMAIGTMSAVGQTGTCPPERCPAQLHVDAPKQEKPPADPFDFNYGIYSMTEPSALQVMDNGALRLKINFHGPTLIEIYAKDGTLQLSVNEAGIVTVGRDKLDEVSVAFWEAFAKAERELVGKTPCTEPAPTK